VLRALGEREVTWGNVQDWLGLNVGAPGLQLLAERKIAAAIFCLYLCTFVKTINVKFCIYFLPKYFVSKLP
jgi:hypothetical protein